MATTSDAVNLAAGKEATIVTLVDSAGNYYTASGGGGSGGATTIADGADANQGTTTDAKVTGDTAGTVAAKLRGLNTVTGTPSDTSASVTILGRLINLLSRIPAALGSATGANSLPVVIASDQGAVKTRGGATTAALTNVASSASSVAILALNAARIGATIYNDSTATLKLKYGATASATSFTVKLFPDDYHEVPYGYSGQIDGIWDAANGNARVTELT